MQQKAKTLGTDILYHPGVTPHHSHFTYAQCLETIIECSQRSYTLKDNGSLILAEELAKATNDVIQLHLHKQAFSPSLMIPWVANRRGFLMRWNDVVFGSLQILLVDRARDQLPLPFIQCERLAQNCAWCLHILEREAQLQYQYAQENAEAIQKVVDLSPSEYSVLALMTQGLSTRAIADKMHLSKRTIETHQRNIYQILDVHSQREAIQIGIHAGILHHE
jgi:DNA-binding CsgD family transcriptional regulator